MVSLNLRNKFLKIRFICDKKAYIKKGKTKKVYYSYLNVKNIIDNKKFWKTIKRFFSNKSCNCENITLIKNGKLLTSDSKITETFNKYFPNLVMLNSHLKISNNFPSQTPGNGNEVLTTIFK